MSDIRSFIKDQLLEPLKVYPTIIQDTMLEIITQRLETLYEYTLVFPEIVSPDSNRLDILKAIANQFLFTIREDADLQEQINILDNILYLYNKRGSVDTIENMWKYYGGKLPKDVKVVIPSYNLFRYSVSKLSGVHVFPNDPTYTGQGSYNRTGVYEVRLINNSYPVPDLKRFMLNELVAAGNFIYFTNDLHLSILGDSSESNPYRYEVSKNDIFYLQMEALTPVESGMLWSGTDPLSGNSNYLLDEDGKEILDEEGNRVPNPDKTDYYSDLSGRMKIFFEIDLIKELDIVDETYYRALGISILATRTNTVRYSITMMKSTTSILEFLLYCTPTDPSIYIDRNLYNSQGEPVEPTDYKGYFIVGKSLLGEEVV